MIYAIGLWPNLGIINLMQSLTPAAVKNFGPQGIKMKPKRLRMLRRMRKKELVELMSKIPTKYHAEVAEKIKDLIQTEYTVGKWTELVTLLEYYGMKN
jgi:hypothetical protein